MIAKAYDKNYLEHAQINLARLLDFAVYELDYKLTAFYALFLSSTVCQKFEEGNYEVLAGKSGYELAFNVLEEIDPSFKRKEPVFEPNRSPEYWCGWALAYYQWKTSLRFPEINERVPIEEVLALYSPYHEMDITHFVNKMNELYEQAKSESNLKLLRQRTGLSQRQLAFYANIPLRTLQQYEQRQKNINKAQAEYLYSLSKVLNCSMEDLLEKTKD